MTNLINKFLAFADEVQDYRLPAGKLFVLFCAAHQLDVQQMTNLRTHLEHKGVL